MRAYYSASFSEFIASEPDSIIGILATHTSQDLARLQTNAWLAQVSILQMILKPVGNGFICFELLIPRMGKRVDTVLVISGVIFVLEFKVGETNFKQADIRQVENYAIDLSCFHETSHNQIIIPLLIATAAEDHLVDDLQIGKKDSETRNVLRAIRTNSNYLLNHIQYCKNFFRDVNSIDPINWLNGQYKPTPTIIEAAKALYSSHDVTDIARNDAGAMNISETTSTIDGIIHDAHSQNKKVICFVTGVPGAGKTLVGLNVATNHSNPDEEQAVFLSGNGPLVEVLREALARDSSNRSCPKISIDTARRETASFIQNIHHFRDEALRNTKPPINRVVIFDEAQRAWNKEKASQFMRQKRNQPDFDQSEPEFLIDVMNRHDG